MLEEIVKDDVHSIKASNQPLFDVSTDFAALREQQDALVAKWKALGVAERMQYTDIEDFKTKAGLPNLKSDILQPARNFYLISSEVQARLRSQDDLRLLPIEGIDFDDSVIELAESLENVPDIRELYRLRKKTVGKSANSGINAEEALRLKNCFSQGRELYLAGRNGSLMVKPLNFFYAMTAYAYGIIVLNNPLRFNKGNLPGSHGLGYLPDVVQAQFGGDVARGTFSDLVTSFPTQLVKGINLEMHLDCTESILSYYENRFSVSLGTLLSIVPEMAAYYKLTTGLSSRCFPLEIVSANDPRSLKWEFRIGNGEIRPRPSSIDESFPGFESSERFGKTVVIVPAGDIHRLRSCIYSDTYGNFWFIDNPFFPVILPEIAVNFLISYIFSNIMRYRPDEWGNVLTNDVPSNVSLLTRHYFSSLQRKFFILVLRSISRYIPYVTQN
ncbi:MAG TPA: YaaC family protein [Hyphomicrobiales bacterium]|nr:YaaC family protein [Hyphomicrobiales bacterium]